VWIRARCQPSKFTPGRIDLKILEIKLLSELKGTLLNSITIELPARLVKNGFIQTLSEFMPPAHQHKAELSFKIYDSELDKSVRLRSRRKPTITEELIDFLSENDEVSFKINE
jgi:DNA polymerase-3 subunit alpha